MHLHYKNVIMPFLNVFIEAVHFSHKHLSHAHFSFVTHFTRTAERVQKETVIFGHL